MIVYGVNPVLESLRSPHLPAEIFIRQNKDTDAVKRITAAAARHSIPVRRVDDVDKRCGSREHQGVCALIDHELSLPLPQEPLLFDRVVVLDGIQDPHNFGAALRVCEVFGWQHVVYHKGNSCGLTPAAVKASTGAVFHLNVYRSNLNAAIKKFKSALFTIMVLDGSGPVDITDAGPAERLCLVIGSEGTGVRHAIRRQADILVAIPTRGKIGSLNVSCALATALHERTRALPLTTSG